ncbi:MAG: capsule polysaccharide biosynthesis family protein [Anaerolineaceae bacterium]|nr:MAG: capsule polysaccharide biosynthesis family protein [Anaerolineaceae bacterium]
MSAKDSLKNIIGELPLSAEIYWLLRRKQYGGGHFNLRALEKLLPGLREQVEPLARKAPRGRHVLIFSTLHYWIEHAALTGLALAGRGHRVTFAWLPYSNWFSPVNKFDLRKRDLYVSNLLQAAGPLLEPLPLLRARRAAALPEALQREVDQVAIYDTQYTMQVEDVDRSSEVYRLRRARNDFAARTTYAWMKSHRPDAVLIPNGMILEFGAVYAAARALDIPAVTYEFGDQANRVWMANNSQIVRHDTGDLWAARKSQPLTADQRGWLEYLLKARQNVTPDDTFARLYPQFASAQGGDRIRRILGLDERPIVLLPTNVLGDSLTLGRQVLAGTMTEWITGVVRYFAGRPEVQLVLRIHPGEAISRGPSIEEEIRKVTPELPEHIHLVRPKDPVNTYDLIAITDLALTYTTTTGLEIATRGIPVITGGETHYRGRGFTIDPASWDETIAALDRVLPQLGRLRLTPEQLDLAWNYAYRFFKEYPRPFPWHLARTIDDLKTRPMEYVFSEAGLAQYADTLDQLAGAPMDWSNI